MDGRDFRDVLFEGSLDALLKGDCTRRTPDARSQEPHPDDPVRADVVGVLVEGAEQRYRGSEGGHGVGCRRSVPEDVDDRSGNLAETGQLGLQVGQLTAGRSADFIVLSANPLDDITNMRQIEQVFLKGVEVDREGLREQWTGR